MPDNANNNTATGNTPNATGSRPPRGRGRRVPNRQGRNSNTVFKGKVIDMNSNVFQLPSERKKKSQFDDTLEALKIYASKEHSKDIAYLETLFSDLELPVIPKPVKPEVLIQVDEQGNQFSTSPDQVDLDLYDKALDKYDPKCERLNATLRALFNVVWAQTSDLLRNEIQEFEDFDNKVRKTGDVAMLLKLIKDATHDIGQKVNKYDKVDEIQRQFFTYRQMPEDDNATHLKKFKDFVEVLDNHKIDMFYDKMLIEHEKKEDSKQGANAKTDEEYRKIVRSKKMAICFLRRSNLRTYAPILDNLRDQYLLNQDNYPTSLEGAYSLPQNHSSRKKKRNPIPMNYENGRNGHQGTPRSTVTGQSFYQRTMPAGEAAVPGTDGRVSTHVQCWKCDKWGHYADNCPKAANEGEQHFQEDEEFDSAVEEEQELTENEEDEPRVSFQNFMSREQHMIRNSKRKNMNSILIDTGSNISVFNNKALLRNLRDSEHVQRVYTNGGYQDSTKVGFLPGFFEVWYNEDSRLNILSFSDVASKYRITIDTAKENSILVHINKEKVLKFRQVENGLFMLVNFKLNLTHSNYSIDNYSFLTLVSENKKSFTKREIEGANKARKLYHHINMPDHNFFIKLIESNYFRNSPVTVQDAKRAMLIYGTDLAFLKGKSVRKRPDPIKTIQQIPIPQTIFDHHQQINLSMDYMHVQGIAMLLSLDESFKYRILFSTHKKKANKRETLELVKKTINKYKARGLTVVQINADNEFECIREDIRPITLNVVAAEEHVGSIERAIRTNKDDTRAHIHRLPYTHYPVSMVEGAQKHSVIRRNNLPATNGVSSNVSPETLVTGLPPPDYKEVIKLNFGDYVQTYEGITKNTNKSRYIGAIALHPSSNCTGSWYFMSLLTGKKIHRNYWHVLPATQDVLDRVKEIALSQKQPPVDTNFKYDWGMDIDLYDDQGEADTNEIIGEEGAEGGNNSTPILRSDEEDVPNAAENLLTFPNTEEIGLEISDEGEMEENEEIGETEESEEIENEMEENQIIEDEILNDEEVEEEDANVETVNAPAIRRSSRNVERMDYAALHRRGRANFQIKGAKIFMQRAKKIARKIGKKTNVVVKDMFKKIVSITMAHIKSASKHEQVSMKEGIKRYGQAAIQAVLKEYAQLNDKKIFRAVKRSALTREQRKNALTLITLIKYKRSGTVKGRACADGRKQRKFISKDEAVSPAVSLESIIMSLIIDAVEGRDTATADIAGAYLFALMDEFVLVKLTGESVRIMCETNKEYEKYVEYENGKPVLYLQLVRALYGCIRSALLWYRTFVEELENNGFKLNPYDPCVANKEINGKQCTICWYVDDCKISHLDPTVVDDVILTLEKRFGKMTVKRGKTHTFVGMDFEFTKDGKVKIFMKEYIHECIEAFEETKDKVGGKSATPGKHDLFVVDKDSKSLDDVRSEIFHHIVSKLLYVSKRARIDIDLVISFLCTRVSRSTEEDWEKLRRLLSYLRSTIDLPRVIGATNLDVLHTWVDASYAIHDDMRGHTGGVMSMGVGCVHHKSSKQKLNTKSSTESEVIGASDYVPWTVWLQSFLKHQGYDLSASYYYQDNESAMRLEKNGIMSSGDKTRHIKIRYYFISDILRRENLKLTHCRSEKMVADYFSKPLQGGIFKKMRNKIMGLYPMLTEERVEENTKNYNGQEKLSPVITEHKPISMSYADAVRKN